MKTPFKKIEFEWRYKGKEHYVGSGTGLVVPFHGIPVYVPAGSAHELRRCKKLMKRAANLSERLGDALLELGELEEFNERKFAAMVRKKGPLKETAPEHDDG